MNKLKIAVCFAFLVVYVGMASDADAQKRPGKTKLGKICGNPQKDCLTNKEYFQDYEIPFEIPASGNNVIVESEPFYTIILKTLRANSEINCESAVSETERLEIQTLFPNNKVFALKCADAGNLYYTNVANDVNFIAAYAGKTLAEAQKFLKAVKATGKFKDAIIRRTQAGFNGT